uniref:Armadillo repeat-containing protein 8 n=1 Tax=Lotharella globosa TaxID=91324 RepID=A0A7S3ZCR2_9EUKA
MVLGIKLSPPIEHSISGLMVKLSNNFEHPSAFPCMLQFVRLRSSRHELLLKTKIVDKLMHVAKNGDLPCRIGAFSCLEELGRHPGMPKDYKSSITAFCIKQCGSDEEAKAKRGALEVLRTMTKKQNVGSLGDSCVPTVTSLLDFKDAEVRMSACETLQYVTVTPIGKELCIKSGAVPKLTSNLEHTNKKVRLFAAAALMQIALLTAGKQAIIDAGGLSILTKALNDEDAIKNYALQCLTNLFSNPHARMAVRGAENNEKIEELTKHKDAIVAESAKSCLAKLLWDP